jgi:hypothetical protein
MLHIYLCFTLSINFKSYNLFLMNSWRAPCASLVLNGVMACRWCRCGAIHDDAGLYFSVQRCCRCRSGAVMNGVWARLLM